MTSRSDLEKHGARLSLDDLAKGLNASIEVVNLGKNTKFSGRMRRWATALLTYIAAEPTVSSRMRKAKGYFSFCRECAIKGAFDRWGKLPSPPFKASWTVFEKRRYLHQISRVSRALREADNELVEQSLEAHWSLLQTPFETPVILLDSFRRFIRERFGGSVVARFSGVGPSASFERSMRDGGAVAEVRDITDRFRERKVTFLGLKEVAASLPSFVVDEIRLEDGSSYAYDVKLCGSRFFGTRTRDTGVFEAQVPLGDVLFPYNRSSGLSLEDWEAKREWLFSLSACWFELDFSQLPRCRQVAVRERGYKVRIVTPLESAFRYLLSSVNGGLLNLLESMPEVVSALHGRPAEKLDWSRGRRGHMVFSADLKSATDHFPHDLMQVAADELSTNWPAELRQLALRAVGPHRMTSPSGEEVVTSRGILMGSPISWPLLSIYTAWLHAESGSDGWYAVCGDDYIGCHTGATYKKYLATRHATGAIGSPGKDILGNQSVGVFAEELVTVGRCRWVPTVSIRAVLADSKTDRPSWTQGPEVAAALEALALPVSDRHRICESLHSKIYLPLLKLGIDPHAPRWCGGAGFPGIPKPTSLVRARRMISQRKEQVITWITRFESAWSTASSSEMLVGAVEEDLQRNIEFMTVVTDERGEWGPIRDVVSSRLGTLSWPFLLAGLGSRSRSVELHRVARTLRSVSKEIAERGFWLESDAEVSSPEGIVRWLIDHEPKCRPIPFQPLLSGSTITGSGSGLRVFGKRPRTGPGSPDWGARKRARLESR